MGSIASSISTQFLCYFRTTGGVTAQGAISNTLSIGADEEPTLILGIDGTAHSTGSGGGSGGGSVTKDVQGQKTFNLEEIE